MAIRKQLEDDAPDFYSGIQKVEKPMKPTAKFHGYPKFWYARRGESDVKFVMSRMRVIPENLKQEVSNEYERLFFQDDGRKKANTYLHNTAVKYK
ncbi:hypothetical protein [Shewanella sp. T24-MNA-CIBAN-0130]|uniref:hypothetical protein n=1 Tax=Shewanella sp. T24-MNA-CIBAN-0130 TaxID=3140470 RepID=UPI0033254702